MEMKRKEEKREGKWLILSCQFYFAPRRFQPPSHLSSRASTKLFEPRGREGRGMKESSGAQRRDKIEGRPVTDLMAARLSIPGFRAATDNSVMRLHSAFTGGKNVPLNFNLSGPFIWPSPLFKFYICLWKFVAVSEREWAQFFFFFLNVFHAINSYEISRTNENIIIYDIINRSAIEASIHGENINRNLIYKYNKYIHNMYIIHI